MGKCLTIVLLSYSSLLVNRMFCCVRLRAKHSIERGYSALISQTKQKENKSKELSTIYCKYVEHTNPFARVYNECDRHIECNHQCFLLWFGFINPYQNIWHSDWIIRKVYFPSISLSIQLTHSIDLARVKRKEPPKLKLIHSNRWLLFDLFFHSN